MNLFVVTGQKKTKAIFDKLKQSVNLQFKEVSSAKQIILSADEQDFYYFDITQMAPNECAQLLRILHKNTAIRYGIIDWKNSLADSAALFHKGASDYLGKELLAQNNLTGNRLKRALDFRQCPVPGQSSVSKEKYLCSGTDWKRVKIGKEYTFALLFVELDNKALLKANHNARYVGRLHQVFQEIIQTETAEAGGLIWMWTDFGGLVLFPFDGKNCPALLSALRLSMNNRILSVERPEVRTVFSYRLALHIGNTVYHKRGKTGTIISDSINSVFHLGQKFAKPGQLYLTEQVRPFVPDKLLNYFNLADTYEGRKIFRFKLLSP